MMNRSEQPKLRIIVQTLSDDRYLAETTFFAKILWFKRVKYFFLKRSTNELGECAILFSSPHLGFN